MFLSVVVVFLFVCTRTHLVSLGRARHAKATTKKFSKEPVGMQIADSHE